MSKRTPHNRPQIRQQAYGRRQIRNFRRTPFPNQLLRQMKILLPIYQSIPQMKQMKIPLMMLTDIQNSPTFPKLLGVCRQIILTRRRFYRSSMMQTLMKTIPTPIYQSLYPRKRTHQATSSSKAMQKTQRRAGFR